MTIKRKVDDILDAMSDDVYIKRDEVSLMAFKDGYSQGYEDAVKKACEWLNEVLYEGHINSSMNKVRLIDCFRKAMEE